MIKMRTKYFWMLLVACVLGVQAMSAQNNQKHGRKRITMEQMVDMQARKIVNDLGLDDATAAKFTDVYKKYMNEINDLRKKDTPKVKKENKDEGKAPKNMTDADIDKMMKDRFIQSRKMLDIREKYYHEFRKFLSPKQVQKVYNQGQMNHGRFNQEMNRRAGMKRPDGEKRMR